MAGSPEQAAFEAFKAVFDADTGSGGLQENASGNNAYVGGGFRLADDPKRTSLPEWIAFDMPGDVERDVFGQGSSGSGRVEATVNLHIYAKRDTSPARVFGILERVRQKFHGATLATTQGWAFSAKVHRVRGFKAAEADNTVHRVEQFIVSMRRS